MLRIFSTLSAAIALLLMGATAQQASAKSRVTIGVTETLTGHNPHADSVALGYALWCQVYGCLGTWDFKKAEWVGMLAESWEITDPNTWVFKLKKGVMRHDGKAELTSADVVHSINRIRTDPRSAQKQNVKKIKKAEAVDKYTVKLTTQQPTAPLLSFVFDRVMITSKELFDKYGAREADRKHPHGFGPYKLKKLAIGERVVIEKNESWPGIKANNPDEIIFQIMKEPEQRITALLNGEIQIAQFIPPHLLPRVANSKVARIVETGSVEMMFLAMNPKFKPWDNKNLRQAVSYAIDREKIIKSVLREQAIILNGPLGPQQFGYPKSVTPTYRYDPKKARELVKKAGYPNGIEVNLITPVNRYVNDKQVAEAMIPMLNAVGIKARLKTPEWATMWSDVIRGKSAFYMMGRGGMVDPSGALSQYFETGVAPRITYSNPKLDTLLQKERATFNVEERKKVLNKAINVILDDAPAHFLWLQKIQYGVAKGVNIEVRPDHFVYGWLITVDK
ncbi:MAG: ABC transporter substrate-binding protein [Proteobacteria bacterium]|nr:ABC transporter substrate-binding protein [Pseudomonadota bacterium]MDA1327054.1 ABC transporter substrate-binding protein [Pseudomonadota bacterium]